MGTHQLEHSDVVLTNTHEDGECWNEVCTLHNMTDHHMRAFPQHWRSDRGIMERTCPHGVGHPDPDSPWKQGSDEWIHGCDGCCLGPDGFDAVQQECEEPTEVVADHETDRLAAQLYRTEGGSEWWTTLPVGIKNQYRKRVS